MSTSSAASSSRGWWIWAGASARRAVPREEPAISLGRQRFIAPDRAGLPPLGGLCAAWRSNGATRRVGYTEASRGCKHLCRHCPVVPVYQGVFRIVQRDVVLADIRQQVAAGAQHITFGDPDFFNGPGHAMPIVEALHREWPDLTYDVTIKVEHLLKHRDLLPVLRRTGCLFVTTAVESLDDAVLATLAKGHTRADFRGSASPDARGRPAAFAHVHPVHAVDHARRVSPASCASWRAGSGGTGGAGAACDPVADSGGLAVAGIAGGAGDGGAVRRGRPVLSVENSGRARGFSVRAVSTIQCTAARSAGRAVGRFSARSATARGCGRVGWRRRWPRARRFLI